MTLDNCMELEAGTDHNCLEMQTQFWCEPMSCGRNACMPGKAGDKLFVGCFQPATEVSGRDCILPSLQERKRKGVSV